jgi:hypothetical protein
MRSTGTCAVPDGAGFSRVAACMIFIPLEAILMMHDIGTFLDFGKFVFHLHHVH